MRETPYVTAARPSNVLPHKLCPEPVGNQNQVESKLPTHKIIQNEIELDSKYAALNRGDKDENEPEGMMP